jgi:hypothetical protein
MFGLYGGMFSLVYLTAWMMQSYMFSGEDGDVDFLLSKAKSSYSLSRVISAVLYGMEIRATARPHPKLGFKKHGNGIHPSMCFLFKCVS